MIITSNGMDITFKLLNQLAEDQREREDWQDDASAEAVEEISEQYEDSEIEVVES